MDNFKKLIKEALTPHYLKESVNEDFTHSSLAITDQSQISGLDDSELLDLLNKVSYEYTPELKNSARIISQEIEDRDLTNKIHYVDNERYEFRESVNEDIQPLAVEELTDEALLDMLNNIDDMSRDKKGGTYDMSGRKMTRAQYDLAKSVEAEVRRRNLDLSLDIDDSYEIGESVNEGFEWYQPLLALAGGVGLMATTLFSIFGPSALVGGAPFGGDSWGDVFRHYKKKFKDKQAAKNLRKEDVQELVNLIQTNIDTSDLNPGVKRYMKRLMNELENEMNKDEEELDKNKLLVLLRNVENYAKRNQVSINEAKTESELKDAWREWNKKHPKDQIDWGEYREEHGEHLDEVTKEEIDDIENSGNIDIAYKKAMKLLKSLKDESVNEMQAVNKKTGKDITKHIIDFLEKKITKKEFEDLTGIKDESLNEGGWKTQGHRKGWKANPKPKQDQLQAAIKAYDKAESEGDIRGMELALAVMDMLKDESVNESVYGSVGFTPSDKDAKPEHPNWRDLSAEEIQDYIDANPNTLWGRSLSRAKMVLRDKKSKKSEMSVGSMKRLKGWDLEESVNEDIVDDKAKIYWLQKLKSGEIDTLPDNPRMEYLRHAMRDQLAQDKEQLSRERNDLSKSSSLIGRMGDRNLEESVNEGYLERAIEDEKDPKKLAMLKAKKEFYDNNPKEKRREMSDEEEHEHVKNLLKRNFMDEAEARINELFGIGGPSPRDKKNQAARQRSSNKTANYHDLLKYYQFGIARIPRHKREKAGIPQAMHDRYGQEVWDILKKAYPNKGLSDTPPSDWRDSANELIMALGDEGNFKKTIYNPFYDIYAKLGPTDSHKKQLGIEEESDTGGGPVNPVNLTIDDEGASDAALDSEVNKMGYAESKEFDFKKMVKEALKSKYLR